MKATKLFKEFFESEKTAGLVLIVCTVVSLVIANTSFGESYHHFWQTKVGSHSIEHWINDGLMAIFFLLIGLELEREIYIGELSNFKDALLPIFAAIGGVIAPATIYFLFNNGSPTAAGIGIPMATDIAFALAILSLLGNRVPMALKVFLTALAVIDDLIAITVIAIFYTKTLVLTNLFISLGIFAVLLVLNRLKVHTLIPYLIGGVLMWYFMLNSGVHATVTGVLLAFAIPFGDGDEDSPSYGLQHFLHTPVAFLILPIFALANTAIDISGNLSEALSAAHSKGIIFGLCIGAPIGVFSFTFLATKLGISQLPSNLSWKAILGVGFLSGIGFTMSIFITLLAFTDSAVINTAKLAIMIGSLISGIIGYTILRMNFKTTLVEE